MPFLLLAINGCYYGSGLIRKQNQRDWPFPAFG